MAKLECEFFPDTPAQWSCSDCHTLYGENCIPAGNSSHWGRQSPTCIRCQGPLNHLGKATDAKPFWQQLPHFFAYPLHVNALVLIALVSVLPLLLQAGLLGLLVSIFCLAALIKYGLAIISERGRGVVQPPKLGAVLQGDGDHLFLRQIGLFVVMGAAIMLAAQVSGFLGLVVAGFMILALPASIIVLAVDKSIRRAINPLNLLNFMLTIGWPYLLLWLCTQVIALGPYLITDYLVTTPDATRPELTSEPATAVVALINVIGNYFTLVLYAMLGYVLFEYQHELGYEADNLEDDNDLSELDFKRARALGETAVLISDHEYQKARRVLRQALEEVRDDIDLHFQYHKLLMLLDDDESLENHGQYLVNLLFEQNLPAKAAPVVLDVQKRLPGFKLDSTRQALSVAKTLAQQGQFHCAVKLFENHHKRQPKDPMLPAVYLFVARVLMEHLNRDDQARAIAKYVLKTRPDCSERKEFEQLLSAVSTTH